MLFNILWICLFAAVLSVKASREKQQIPILNVIALVLGIIRLCGLRNCLYILQSTLLYGGLAHFQLGIHQPVVDALLLQKLIMCADLRHTMFINDHQPVRIAQS